VLQKETTALALIDVQGKLATLMDGREELYRQLQILVKGAQALELPIFWMEQYPEGLGPTIPELAELLPNQQPLAKRCFSACGQEEFRNGLQKSGRRQVIVAGIETHICVYQTARHLLDEDYYVEIVGDAVSSRTAANKALGIDKMVRAGAQVTSVEMALFELLGEAGTPQFKTIARLVK